MLLEEVEHRDVEFPAGTVVFASAWNANREAAGDERPERFDITADRGSAKSLTFGAGPHFCLGANLARAELQEGLTFLARHMPGLELDGEPVYGSITGLYGMEALPVRWAAGGVASGEGPDRHPDLRILPGASSTGAVTWGGTCVGESGA